MQASWISALIGGGLIGLAATIHLLLSGRITGVSGIYSGLFTNKGLEFLWRFKFVIGLLIGGILSSFFLEEAFVNQAQRSTAIVIIAGLLVGFGTRLGSGCTSGHGVCGISRLSLRSIVATVTFMSSGIITVYLFNYFMGQ